jgi:hypothetical protein
MHMMAKFNWADFTRNLHRYSKVQVFLACMVLALAWSMIFSCLGRVVCAPQTDSAAATKSPAGGGTPPGKAPPTEVTHASAGQKTDMKSPAGGGTSPGKTRPTEVISTSAARKIATTCFGLNCPGAVTTDTLIWYLASFFPATAILYSLYNLLVRLREIEHAAQMTQLHYLYTEIPSPKSDEEAWTQFQNYARARFWEYYNPWELTAFALGAGVLVVVLAKLVVAKQLSADYLGPPLDLKALPVAFTAAAGLLGSTIGAMLFVLRRFRTFNIYAFTYFQVLVAIAAGTFAGTFWHLMFAENVAIFLAFGIAFLSALNIDYMVDLMIILVAKATGQPTVAPPQSDLATVILNPDAIDVLNTMSVFSIAEFVNTDPMRLYLNLPQSIGAIDGWIDQALLRFHFSNQQQIDAFAAAGVRQFSQLLNRFAQTITSVAALYAHADIVWRLLQPAELIDNINMDRVFATIKDVVQSGRYDRQLAVVSERFRVGRFPPLSPSTS